MGGCQSTQDVNVEEPPSMNVEVRAPLAPAVKVSVGAIDSTSVESRRIEPPKGRQSIDALSQIQELSKVDFPLLNMQACRDDVDVTYSVTSPDGVKGTFPAKVQAQGVVLALSRDQQKIKIRTTGWYSKNNNLLRWMPYLRQPPIAKRILLTNGAEFWDIKTQWYKCDLKPLAQTRSR